MKGGLPGWTRPRDQQHNGQRNAHKPVCTSIRQGKGGKTVPDASAKHQSMRLEVTRDNRANYRSKPSPDETLPGHLQRCPQRRLCNHNGCDWCPVRLWQPEQTRDQHRSNRRHGRARRMHQYYPASCLSPAIFFLPPRPALPLLARKKSTYETRHQ